MSATQCFLKYLEYPECEEAPIDLKQAAVIVMSHLDRLSIPHQPALEQNVFYATVAEPQEVHCLGQVTWGAPSEFSHRLGSVEVSALAAYNRGALGIAKRGGKMFYLGYDGDKLHYLDTSLRFRDHVYLTSAKKIIMFPPLHLDSGNFPCIKFRVHATSQVQRTRTSHKYESSVRWRRAATGTTDSR